MSKSLPCLFFYYAHRRRTCATTRRKGGLEALFCWGTRRCQVRGECGRLHFVLSLPPSFRLPSLLRSYLSYIFHSLTLFSSLLPSPPSLPVNIDATEGVEYVEEEEVVQEAGK